MKLPNGDKAVIDDAKIVDYLLSQSHPVGRFKAAAFGSFGFGPDNWVHFKTLLSELARTGDAKLGDRTKYGRKYLVSGPIVGPAGSGEVVSVWMIPAKDDKPHLITVYPK